jgi:hypothetical protein
MVETASAAIPFARLAANVRLGRLNDVIVVSSFYDGTQTLAFGITASSSADASYPCSFQGIGMEYR